MALTKTELEHIRNIYTHANPFALRKFVGQLLQQVAQDEIDIDYWMNKVTGDCGAFNGLHGVNRPKEPQC